MFRRLIMFLIIGALLTVNYPVARADHTSSYISLNQVSVFSPINTYEEGVIIFVKVHSKTDSTISALIRYPDKGKVLYLNKDRLAVLAPVLIPSGGDVRLDIIAVAVPTNITAEGINILEFVVGEVADIIISAIPGIRLIKFIGKYITSRISDETFDALQEGRVIGSSQVYAKDVAQNRGISTSEFAITISTRTSNVPGSNSSRQMPTGYINVLEINHNVYENNMKGMLIHVKTVVEGSKNNKIRIAAHVHYAGGDHVTKPDGSLIMVSQDLSPSSNNTEYKDIHLFLPYKQFGFLYSGTYNFMFHVSLKDYGTQKEFALSKDYNFQYTSP